MAPRRYCRPQVSCLRRLWLVSLASFQQFSNLHWISGDGMVRAKVSGGVCRLRAMLPYLNCGIASFSSLFLLLAICVAAVPVKAANSHGQLVMITTSHCPWCEAFEDEVGAGYDRTEEALTYPLRRHDFYHAMPDDLAHLTPATMTPTFIVMRDGMEVGRIVGYPGAELFWWRISEFTAQ